jgi:hypothetical protein
VLGRRRGPGLQGGRARGLLDARQPGVVAVVEEKNAGWELVRGACGRWSGRQTTGHCHARERPVGGDLAAGTCPAGGGLVAVSRGGRCWGRAGGRTVEPNLAPATKVDGVRKSRLCGAVRRGDGRSIAIGLSQEGRGGCSCYECHNKDLRAVTSQSAYLAERVEKAVLPRAVQDRVVGVEGLL